jgi:RHO1 GDP-GTP exchange protein 1/2
VDRHGEPSRSPGVVEWEGTAERVAFHPPYILIFDTRFIEVRHIDKGNLVQIIPGVDLHCTWDGRGYFTAPTPMSPIPGGWDDHSPGEATIHAVMKAEEVPNASTRASPQHVFELAPTQLLYAPPELAAQSPAGFTPRKYSSPPHSPRPSSVGSGWAK